MNKRSLVSAMRWSCAGLTVFLSGCNMEVLSPKGEVGMQEKSLILIALGLMLLVVIPVIVMTLVFAWRYRASNTKATYAPKWSHSTAIEAVVWAIPCVIIAILGAITWRTSHTLDPYKPLDSKVKPITIQAVALDWKWLFIYPQEQVAAVNELVIPTNTPIHFKLTSGSVMNSFFVPQLGSQIYTMAGMTTQLNLLASNAGTYPGISAQFSGDGFSDMRFDVRAVPAEEYQAWVASTRTVTNHLDADRYAELAAPSRADEPTTFGDVTIGLFDGIVHNHGAPTSSSKEAL